MVYNIENERYIVKVNDVGAELWSIYDKRFGKERLWQADPEVWDRKAPIIFPYCGRLKDDSYVVRGISYKGINHGFARFCCHKLVKITDTSIELILIWDSFTMSLYPYKFSLKTSYILDYNKLHCIYQISNLGEQDMFFNVGYHLGINCPFDTGHTLKDYKIVFEKTESPTRIVHGKDGIRTGEVIPVFSNLNEISLNEGMFSPSILLTGLISDYVQLEEISSGQYIRFYIKGFPYVVFWSKPGNMRYLCIEPWFGLPDSSDCNGDFMNKQGIQKLKQYENFNCDQIVELSGQYKSI